MSRKKKIYIFENTHTLTNYLLQLWMKTGETAVEDKGFFAAALTGGRTPVEFYCKLSGMTKWKAWDKTNLFLTDERFVPWDSPDSNYGMIKENLLDFIHLPSSQTFPIPTDTADIETSSALYEKTLMDFFKAVEEPAPILDFVLLGLGTDGHIASLFPQHPACSESQRLVSAVSTAASSVDRITLTFPLLNQAKQLVFCVNGEAKADIVYDILEGKKDVPAARLDPLNGEIMFLLDSAAAQRLSIGEDYQNRDQAVIFESES